MTTSPGKLDYERHALRWTLMRLLAPNQDVELLCKYVPRLANSAANVTRADNADKLQRMPAGYDEVEQALKDLIEERIEKEEGD